VARMLGELVADLREGCYRPLPGRRVWIPKPGTGERRPLSIPAVRDRVVQAALRIVIEPIFEADFLPCSFGFRPKRAAQDALQVLIDEAWWGRRWVVETDIASCFEAIPHDRLMAVIEKRVCDRHVLKLLRAMLRAGVLEEGSVWHRETGTPQGGVVSPLLANVYLNQLDRAWQRQGRGVLCRYADDLVVMCRSRQEAEQALTALRTVLGELGLALKEAKTRIVHLEEGGEGLDFLGFHHRWVRSRGKRGGRRLTFLARWPSRKAMQTARDRLHELTSRKRLRLPIDQVVKEMNRFLQGWAGYFRYGNSALHFVRVRNFALTRVAIFVANRHKKPRSYGWESVVYLSHNNLGLINLNGSVRAPRPNRPWRVRLNAAGEGRR
jgi:group II intron reverse transcriptase/maturase